MSDLHLGADNCEAEILHNFLTNIEFDRLILNGDTFESLDFRRFEARHWDILSMLRSDRVIWVCGNHEESSDKLSTLLNIKVYDEYSFEDMGKKVLVLHGHMFDEFLSAHPILTWVSDLIYGFLQKLDNSHYLAKLAKHSSKSYLHCAEHIKLKAVGYADRYDIVCCGHVHRASVDKVGEVCYYNSGSWTEKPCSYLEMVNGEMRLQEFYG